VLCDRASVDDVLVDELRARFPEHDVDTCPASDVSRRVHDACLVSRTFVGVAGDGDTLRSAAEALARSETALLPLPMGTHRDLVVALGIETLDDAVKAAECRNAVLIDVGRVNGRAFLHTAMLGFAPPDHPGVQAVRAAWQEVRVNRRLIVRIDGRAVPAWSVIVGNGCFGPRVGDVASRERFDDHLLDFRVARADQRFARLRIVIASRAQTSAPALERRTLTSMTIGLRGRSAIDVTLDGSVLTLDGPLRFESDAGALRVLVPS
jgi:undecaprenyl-diphosphatase